MDVDLTDWAEKVLDDLSIQETAARTGRSIPAVKAMQRRAIISLRTALAASEP